MPLINKLNDTKLRSLKWGNDKPHGGSSKEPYITTDIKAVDSLGNQIRILQADDGLVRGGAVGAIQSSVTDTLRIGKFLTDIPKGPLFIVKQVGLQLSNPKLESRANPLGRVNLGNNILNTAVNAGVNLLNAAQNVIGPTRIYNLGINTLAQVPVNALGIHIQRHGLTPFTDDSQKYGQFVLQNDTDSSDNNRLVKLQTRFFSTNENVDTKNSSLINFLSTSVPILNTLGNNNLFIDNYIGGPNSTYGIGRTIIRRYDNTNNNDRTNTILAHGKKVTRLQTSYDTPLDINRFINKKGPSAVSGGDVPNTLPADRDVNNSIPYSTLGKSYDTIKGILDNQKKNMSGPSLAPTAISGSIVNTTGYRGNNAGSWAKPYSDINMEKRIGVAKGTRDEINLTPLFLSDGPLPDNTTLSIPGTKAKMRDLIKFRIEAVDSDNPLQSVWMVFRAYLKGLTDTPSSNWDAVKYIGRGEEFYTYNTWSRTISFNFQVAALSAEEMEPMYQKLNFLMSNTAPDYSSQYLVRSPLMKITIGNYLYRELGFISSLTYTISEQTPWEIALYEPEGIGPMMYELPMVMDVNISFKLIHNFLPQKSIADSPFIINKPKEDITAPGAKQVDNPWLKTKINNEYQDDKKLTAATKK